MGSKNTWYKKNKDDQEFIDLYQEYKINCKDNQIKPSSYKSFLLEYYEENLAMELE